MKRNIIYISCLSVLALFSACTDTSNDPVTTEPIRGSLKITARAGSDQTWKNFNNGNVITVYNSYQITDIAADKKGKYQFNGESWENQPTDDFIGLWPDAIKADEAEKAYFFTATFNTEATGVVLDQTKKSVFETQDFCVARAVYQENDKRFNDDAQAYWQNTGLFLHFRHVLSKLRVNLYLPIGTSGDGYFTAANAISNVKMNLKTPYTQYTVNYGTSLRDSEIADVTTGTAKASTDLNMYASEVKDENMTVPGTSISAKKCSFEAIIPSGQAYQKDKECLTVTLSYKGGNKTYTYSPPSNTTMLFQQEKVTVVNLTLLASKPNEMVMINSVSLQDWITDEADMDLIPVPSN